MNISCIHAHRYLYLTHICIDINILNICKYIIYVICLYMYVYILCFLLYIIFLCLSRNGFSFQGYSYCFFNNDKL